MEALEGKTAVVTGAASGIGLAVAGAFVRVGMNVVMADVDAEGIGRASTQLTAEGGSVLGTILDVRDADAVERVGEAAVERFGGLHVAVNNAGVVNRGYSWELSLDEWHRIIDVDFWGVVHGVRSFVPRILATGEEGYVVNVASMAAVAPRDRLGPYTAAKHAVLGLTDVLRAELSALGAPVGASVVMPGMIRTGLNPIGSVEPSAVAANVLDAIRRGRPYVFTDDHHAHEVADRLHAIVSSRADVLSSPPS